MQIFTYTKEASTGERFASLLPGKYIPLPYRYDDAEGISVDVLLSLSKQVRSGDVVLVGWGSPNSVMTFSNQAPISVPLTGNESMGFEARQYRKYYREQQGALFYTQLLNFMTNTVSLHTSLKRLGARLCSYHELDLTDSEDKAIIEAKTRAGFELRLMALYAHQYLPTQPYLGPEAPEDYHDFMERFKHTTYQYWKDEHGYTLSDWVEGLYTHWFN